jgi:hypothetical protein
MKKSRIFVVCIEKKSNLHRIYPIFKDKDLLDKLIICLPKVKNEIEKKYYKNNQYV